MNYERIRTVMQFMNWRWFGVNDTEGHVPSVEELRNVVNNLLDQLNDHPASTISSGGFVAYRVNGTGERCVSFVIDTYEPDLNTV